MRCVLLGYPDSRAPQQRIVGADSQRVPLALSAKLRKTRTEISPSFWAVFGRHWCGPIVVIFTSLFFLYCLNKALLFGDDLLEQSDFFFRCREAFLEDFGRRIVC